MDAKSHHHLCTGIYAVGFTPLIFRFGVIDGPGVIVLGEDKNAVIRRMADLLRAGATMLQERCPICGSPLFRLRSGEVICPIHGRVYIVRSDEEAAKITLKGVLEKLEESIVFKLNSLQRRVNEGGVEEAREIIAWLEALERIERLVSPPMSPKKAEDKG